MDFVVSIQSRMGSSRLPGKTLLPLGHARVLELVYRRCRKAISDSPVVVATGDRPENESISEFCKRNDYEYVIGSEENLLARHRAVASEYDADALVRVTADSPFLPPIEIERLVTRHKENAARYTSDLGTDMPGGTMADITDRTLLDDLAAAEETHPAKRQLDEPDQWQTDFSAHPDIKPYDTSVAVDYPHEYWRLVDAVDAVGTEPMDVLAWVDE